MYNVACNLDIFVGDQHVIDHYLASQAACTKYMHISVVKMVHDLLSLGKSSLKCLCVFVCTVTNDKFDTLFSFHLFYLKL